MRSCSVCGETKPETEFWRKRDGINSACRVCAAEAKRKRYDPDKARATNRRYYLKNRDAVRTSNKQYYQAHRDQYAKQNHDRYQRIKRDCTQLVFDHYGRSCACCGETIPLLLTIDHINNDGAKHRRQLSGSRTGKVGAWFYKWLVDNGLPPVYQTLCWNCNMGKHINGGVSLSRNKLILNIYSMLCRQKKT